MNARDFIQTAMLIVATLLLSNAAIIWLITMLSANFKSWADHFARHARQNFSKTLPEWIEQLQREATYCFVFACILLIIQIFM